MEVVFEHDVRKVIIYFRKPSGATQKAYSGCQVLLKKDLADNIYRFAVKNSKHKQKFDHHGRRIHELPQESGLSIIPDHTPHYYGKGDIEQIEVHFVHEKDQKLWLEFLRELVMGKRTSKNDPSTSSSEEDNKISPRGKEDEHPEGIPTRRRRSTSSRKKNDTSKSLPSSPVLQPAIRSSTTTTHPPKKRHSGTSNSHAVTKDTVAHSRTLHQSMPDMSHHITEAPPKTMDLEMLGHLVQTLIQQNSMLVHKVDSLAQEVSALKGASPSPRHYHPLSGTSSGAMLSSNSSSQLLSNPLAQSNSNNPLASSNPSNPLSLSNPNIILTSRATPNSPPTHFSPPYQSPVSPAFPFSAHPLELRGVSMSPGTSSLSNPFTTTLTTSNPTNQQSLSLASFPH